MQLNSEFDVDVEATLATADNNIASCYSCAPQAILQQRSCSNSVVENIANRFTTGIIVVDEAYIDFSGTGERVLSD